MRPSELSGELVDRGIYWQLGGFTVMALTSVVILAEFANSDSRAFLYFEIAVTRLYWAFLIPLAGLFDGVRKMFEKMSEIRAQRKQRWLEEGQREGRRMEREQVKEELARMGVALPKEALEYLEGKAPDDAP